MTKRQSVKRIQKPKSRKIITEVRLIREVDDSPDTSWLGEYGNKPTSEFSIDRAHALDCQSVNPENESTVQTLESAIDHVMHADAESDFYDGDAVDLLREKQDEVAECDCGERGDMERNEYRYFNPGSVEAFDLAASWIPATVVGEDERREYWRRTMQDNARKDYERMQAGSRGDYCYLYIRAEADIIIGGKVTSQTGLIQTLTSGGLSGVESDAGDDYMADIEREELGTLRGQLVDLGFSRRAVAAAFKDIKRKEDC